VTEKYFLFQWVTSGRETTIREIEGIRDRVAATIGAAKMGQRIIEWLLVSKIIARQAVLPMQSRKSYRKNLYRRYRSFLHRETFEQRITYFILMSWRQARGVPNGQGTLPFLAHYSSAGSLFNRIGYCLRQSATQLEKQIMDCKKHERKKYLIIFVPISSLIFADLITIISTWISIFHNGFYIFKILSFLITTLISILLWLLTVEAGRTVNDDSIKFLMEYDESLNYQLFKQLVSLSSYIKNELLTRVSEMLKILQEQHAKRLQSLMGAFLRLRFVGASTGGITSSSSETHALSLLSVRLSAFAGIGMSHFIASSTSHCKYGDRAYGLS
jgi:hypothetical protein